MTNSNHANVHALALIKGSVEGDSFKHFGSLFGTSEHARPLVAAGLLVSNGYDYDATDAGRTFYADYRLDSLPRGRANSWLASSDNPDLAAADSALEAAVAAAI
jgi:hypothetical protein